MIQLSERKDLKYVINNLDVVVVRVSAKWCGPCKKSYPIVKNCMELCPDVLYVHVDEKDDSRCFLKVKVYPTLIVFKGGDRQYVCESSKKENILEFFELVKELCEKKVL